jgi:hypothetical protein
LGLMVGPNFSFASLCTSFRLTLSRTTACWQHRQGIGRLTGPASRCGPFTAARRTHSASPTDARRNRDSGARSTTGQPLAWRAPCGQNKLSYSSTEHALCAGLQEIERDRREPRAQEKQGLTVWRERAYTWPVVRMDQLLDQIATSGLQNTAGVSLRSGRTRTAQGCHRRVASVFGRS